MECRWIILYINIKLNYTSISTQRTAMVDNPDYTTEDIAEVDTILTELNALAVSLTI